MPDVAQPGRITGIVACPAYTEVLGTKIEFSFIRFRTNFILHLGFIFADLFRGNFERIGGQFCFLVITEGRVGLKG